MIKPSIKLFVALIAITASALLCLQSSAAKSAVMSETAKIRSLDPSTLVAVAGAPPNLQRSVLGGKPAYVLYVTRDGDNVLVRCYPGYEPTIAVRAMGPNPNATNVQKEGVMTCRPSS